MIMIEHNKAQVRRFYEILWNTQDISAISSILHKQVRFRGSLGTENHGYEGFIEYLDSIHHALADYRCTIHELVAEGNSAFAKMSFGGIHRRNFIGYPPSGKRVEWDGCALFHFDGDLIIDIWVLGDLKGLEAQLENNDIPPPINRSI